jgi:hypothetical protein
MEGLKLPRIVPSQVVTVIDQMFSPRTHREGHFAVSRGESTSIAAIINLVEQIPPQLLVLPGESYAALVSSIASLKTALEGWKFTDEPLHRIRGFGDINPVTLIRDALAQCPDEFPSVGSAILDFIQDQDLRKNLEIDISATNQALSNGEWKAATVLSGSIIEALLLWALKQHQISQVMDAVKQVMGKGIISKNPGKTLEDWGLQAFIEVAAEMDIITPHTTKQAELARGFRNLIHAGREVRLKQRCDRGTALTGVAAMEHVIRDLSS